MNPNKVHDSEIDKDGNFKETLCVTNVLRWLIALTCLVALAWMMGLID